MIKSKEFGSDFHFLTDKNFRNLNVINDFQNLVSQFYFSGRVALYEILNFGIEQKGWKKLYVPTYYCHEVYHFIDNLQIEIIYYQYNPLDNQNNFQIEDNIDNVILNVNYFGILNPNLSHLQNITIIEDITHNLDLIKTSKADFIFGSLRKILPLPVGGFVKTNEDLRTLSCTMFSDEVAMKKSSAMYLKSTYLNGQLESKELFRKLFMESENNFEDQQTISALPNTVKSILETISLSEINEAKKNNLAILKSNICDNNYFKFFSSDNEDDYACILKFSDEKNRNNFRDHLIKNNIFPMVLWPNQINVIDKKVEKTLLFIHVDFRYTKEDMEYIARIMNEYLQN